MKVQATLQCALSIQCVMQYIRIATYVCASGCVQVLANGRYVYIMYY